ncbi:MAG: hypothetical protein LBH39_04565 [Clostridiales Family XIII bacterium]|nr:hypothetical protein [Clostridiales Family XIII bacterium]
MRDITEELPFEIPDSWEWVRLGCVINKLTDGTHSTPKYTESGVPFLSVKDMSDGKLNFSNTKYISPEGHSELYRRCDPERGDILLTKVGTTGIPVLVDTDEVFSLFVSVALLKYSRGNCTIPQALKNLQNENFSATPKAVFPDRRSDWGFKGEKKFSKKMS